MHGSSICGEATDVLGAIAEDGGRGVVLAVFEYLAAVLDGVAADSDSKT